VGLPLVEELSSIPAPFDLFPRFLGTARPVLLDSALVEGRRGRFSLLTADPFLVVQSKGRQITVEGSGRRDRWEGDPFVALRGVLASYRQQPLPEPATFQGGALGYFAYELGRHVERLPARSRDDLHLPEMNVGLYDWALVHDHLEQRAWLVATGWPEGTEPAARRRLAWVRRRLEGRSYPVAHPAGRPASLDGPIAHGLRGTFTRERYLEAIRTAKAYIREGDIYQVNLSQRFEADLAVDAWTLYRRLRQVNPAPFAAFLGFPEVAVLSASPEEFLRLEGRQVQTRPIKGTRPRGATDDEDRRLADDLAASEKDRAENVMIVDLLRNDIGRVCEIGSVCVPELFAVETYPTVFQLVSTVTGRLREGLGAVDLLRACFPGGSVTGAPKVRAMEIIDELEPTERSVYCGALGYISFGGDMLTSIPIRTLLVKDGRVYFQVGGGIVADSDPALEYEETLHKARAAFLALGCAEPLTVGTSPGTERR
jgi:para-aminobenzoate synthetase component 1